MMVMMFAIIFVIILITYYYYYALHIFNLNKPQSVYSIHMTGMALHICSQIKHLPGGRITLEMEAWPRS